MIDVLKAQERRPAMQKISTMRARGSRIFNGWGAAVEITGYEWVALPAKIK
jgi:hypothetical protein